MTADNIIANLHAMKRRPRIAIAIASALLLVLAILALVYFVLLDSFTLVSDSSFRQVFPAGRLLRLRLDYALKGVRLRVRTLDDACFSDNELFCSEISAIRSDYVLLAPLSTWNVCQNRTDVSALLPSSVVLGIGGSEYSDLFDCMLVSDERSGWVLAAQSIADETASISQNVGLVYENETITYADDIVGCFGENRVSVFKSEGTGRLFASETLKSLDNEGIVLVLCPYISGFQRFMDASHSLSWVVDYRFAPAVPSGNLYGLVIPDFGMVLDQARATAKDQGATASLGYVYEKR